MNEHNIEVKSRCEDSKHDVRKKEQQQLQQTRQTIVSGILHWLMRVPTVQGEDKEVLDSQPQVLLMAPGI